jgi:hypothetical protein
VDYVLALLAAIGAALCILGFIFNATARQEEAALGFAVAILGGALCCVGILVA